MERYRIKRPIEETECDYCGCDLIVGDDALESADRVFCSRACAETFTGEAAPAEDDYTLSDSGPLYSRTSVSQGDKFLGEFGTDEEAIRFVQERMEAESFWPDVWHCNDHGNLRRYENFHAC